MTSKIADDLSKLITDYFNNSGFFGGQIRFVISHITASKSRHNPGQTDLKFEGHAFQKYQSPGIPGGVHVIPSPSIPRDQAVLVDGLGQPVAVIHNIGEEADHSGHEVVENTAGGKTFKYCRQCKTEVT